jgi:septal ring factor EnvC (AmiA/AmiB activator)
MKSRLLPLYLLPQVFALTVPALAAEPPAPPAAAAAAEPSDADLRQQLADAQDKLATALHSYTLLDSANSRLQAENAPLRERIRQLQDEVADLAAENARLRTRLALLAPLPGGASAPQHPATPPRSP